MIDDDTKNTEPPEHESAEEMKEDFEDDPATNPEEGQKVPGLPEGLQGA
jgi:hypothetical protein